MLRVDSFPLQLHEFYSLFICCANPPLSQIRGGSCTFKHVYSNYNICVPACPESEAFDYIVLSVIPVFVLRLQIVFKYCLWVFVHFMSYRGFVSIDYYAIYTI